MDRRLEELEFYQKALQLEYPWYVKSRDFNEEEGRLDIFIGVDTKSRFTCSACNSPNQPFYDLSRHDQRWRHLDFWQYKSYLHSPHPRVTCSSCGSVKAALVPWGRHNCSFTLLFEQNVLALVKDMPVIAAARIVREHDTRLWRIVHYYVDKALAHQDLSGLQRISVDETSSRRGHQYVTVFLDSDERKVVFATPGKDAQTISAFRDHLESHKGNTEQISEYCSDMSQAFIRGMTDYFPKAKQTVDKFHVMKLLNEAVDDVRREEQRTTGDLKRSRYIWLKNPKDLKPHQQEQLTSLSQLNLKTGRAYRLKLVFQHLWKLPLLLATAFLDLWYGWARRSRIPQMIQVAQTIRIHEQGIVNWFKSKLTNGLIEAINGLIQAAKRKARGYRSMRNLIAAIYLIGGRLQLGTDN